MPPVFGLRRARDDDSDFGDSTPGGIDHEIRLLEQLVREYHARYQTATFRYESISGRMNQPEVRQVFQTGDQMSTAFRRALQRGVFAEASRGQFMLRDRKVPAAVTALLEHAEEYMAAHRVRTVSEWVLKSRLCNSSQLNARDRIAFADKGDVTKAIDNALRDGVLRHTGYETTKIGTKMGETRVFELVEQPMQTGGPASDQYDVDPAPGPEALDETHRNTTLEMDADTLLLKHVGKYRASHASAPIPESILTGFLGNTQQLNGEYRAVFTSVDVAREALARVVADGRLVVTRRHRDGSRLFNLAATHDATDRKAQLSATFAAEFIARRGTRSIKRHALISMLRNVAQLHGEYREAFEADPSSATDAVDRAVELGWLRQSGQLDGEPLYVHSSDLQTADGPNREGPSEQASRVPPPPRRLGPPLFRGE